MRSIKGIGPVTSAAIIAYLPEIGTFPHKKLAALVGVAPFAADSGNGSGVRFIRGGRGRVRHAFYMAALSACRAEGPVSPSIAGYSIQERGPKKWLRWPVCISCFGSPTRSCVTANSGTLTGEM